MRAGVYTSARTVGRNSVFEFGTHVQRTATSAKYLVEQDVQPLKPHHLSNVMDRETLYPLMKESVALAIDVFNKECQDIPQTDELKITVLVLWNQKLEAWESIYPTLFGKYHFSSKSIDSDTVADVDELAVRPNFQPTDINRIVPHFNSVLITHVTPLHRRRQGPIKVQVGGAPRQHAIIKDSRWVKEREVIETTMDEDIEEVLLMSDKGEILEGTQTNFFAVLDGPSQGEAPDGVVYTSSENILLGTVRKVVLEVCAKYDIPVMYEAPKLNHLVKEQWCGAFITSTSRLVLPIDEITYPSAVHLDIKASQKFPPCPLVQFIQEKVALEVQEHSTKVL